MILDNEFTGDLRVENEVLALREVGFDIFVLCLNYGTKSEYEDFHGAKIIRIPRSKNIIKKLRALTNTIFNFYPHWWAKHIIEFAKKNQIDVLHIHDLYMLGAGFIAQKRLGNVIKIVGDLHENYVEGLRHYKFSTTFPGKCIISIPKWEKIEIEWCKKTNFLITVIEEAVERYISLGIPKKQITVVANYVNLSEFLRYEDNQEIINRFQSQFVITYIGAFDVHRGLEIVIQAMPKIVRNCKNVKLVFVGQGKNSYDLSRLAAGLMVDQNISFEGWQPPANLPSYIKASSICLIPHLKTIHTDNTIPHKLFQYMLLEKPIIATDCNPIKRIIEAADCGLIYKDKDFNQLADSIITLYHQESLMKKLGINGKKAVLEQYNWGKTSRNLTDLYKNISGKDLL
jgi:glycosyltransferase involved in cell wall biosynthesis